VERTAADQIRSGAVPDKSTLNAEIRTEFGKGAARRTRRAGKIPAVLYGHGEQPRHLALPALDFAAAIRYGGMTQVLTVNLPDGTSEIALPKAIQRDPIRDTFKHADLLLVRRGEKITVEIPVQLTGEAARGTLVMLEHDRLAINADATMLPDHLEASVEGLDIGARVTAREVVLPPGAELAADPAMVIAMVGVAPTAEQMEVGAGEVPAEGVELEGALGQPPAEGAPAGEAPATES
jgi:large subunit ribosomal protein L25